MTESELIERAARALDPWTIEGENRTVMARAALTAAQFPQMLEEIARLREALRRVMDETGTSSLAHHTARDALDPS